MHIYEADDARSPLAARTWLRYEYRYRLGKNGRIGKLERINAQDPDCVLCDFGNISVQLMMIEKPVGANVAAPKFIPTTH